MVGNVCQDWGFLEKKQVNADTCEEETAKENEHVKINFEPGVFTLLIWRNIGVAGYPPIFGAFLTHLFNTQTVMSIFLEILKIFENF